MHKFLSAVPKVHYNVTRKLSSDGSVNDYDCNIGLTKTLLMQSAINFAGRCVLVSIQQMIFTFSSCSIY